MRSHIYTLSCSEEQIEEWVKLKKEGKLSNNEWSRMTTGLRNKILRKMGKENYAK